MNKAPTVSVLTANRLRDGTVVFLDFEGAWSETLVEAVVARSPDEVRALKDRGTYDATRNIVVEPYLIEVHETASGLLPIRYRERVRAAGPSVLDDVPGYREPAAGQRQAPPQGAAYGSAREADAPQHREPELVEERPMHGMLAVGHPDLGATHGAHAEAA
jgi:Protein of unknown function (DUF2849)